MAWENIEGLLSKLLVGWVGKWIDLPVLGFWHQEVPDLAPADPARHVPNQSNGQENRADQDEKRAA